MEAHQTDKLASISPPVAEEDQVVTLLGSLSHSYSTLVTALEACADDGLKLSQVQQALIQEDIKNLQTNLSKMLTQMENQVLQQWWEHREVEHMEAEMLFLWLDWSFLLRLP